MSRVYHLTGGCLCGGVRYAYAGPIGGGDLGAVAVCHCAQCRRAQGYAAAVAPILSEGFVILAGRDRVREYESSPGKLRAFCGVCGSPLYSRLAVKPDRLRLRLGSIDDPPDDLVIEVHKFTDGAPAWSQSGGAPRYPGQEPGVR
jgi:hypothetical protein